ncbi:hypothetical protein KNP414_02470 [Paenibacillus mucilaginosus KNP414]|uniref:Uncharacterized protein n=1 Tax=Paenibacillus mucilaginosus (strain KNP414) TaxID=1036673 RepID=F8F846_PAEMK|nr:hypothetical protein KNP414_02470 [Paenibacillus mucilaginosus KNP414]
MYALSSSLAEETGAAAPRTAVPQGSSGEQAVRPRTGALLHEEGAGL